MAALLDFRAPFSTKRVEASPTYPMDSSRIPGRKHLYQNGRPGTIAKSTGPPGLAVYLDPLDFDNPPGGEDPAAVLDLDAARARDSAHRRPGSEELMKVREEELQNLLAALVEQARALAARIAGDPDREAPCHFCGDPVPLWENLLVMQLTGVAAHVQCPQEALERHLKEVGPTPEFPYAEFSEAVDKRLGDGLRQTCSGVIEVAR
jgi:hypothetical protein